jgi:hypothetical protein
MSNFNKLPQMQDILKGAAVLGLAAFGATTLNPNQVLAEAAQDGTGYNKEKAGLLQQAIRKGPKTPEQRSLLKDFVERQIAIDEAKFLAQDGTGYNKEKQAQAEIKNARKTATQNKPKTPNTAISTKKYGDLKIKE